MLYAFLLCFPTHVFTYAHCDQLVCSQRYVVDFGQCRRLESNFISVFSVATHGIPRRVYSLSLSKFVGLATSFSPTMSAQAGPSKSSRAASIHTHGTGDVLSQFFHAANSLSRQDLEQFDHRASQLEGLNVSIARDAMLAAQLQRHEMQASRVFRTNRLLAMHFQESLNWGQDETSSPTTQCASVNTPVP